MIKKALFDLFKGKNDVVIEKLKNFNEIINFLTEVNFNENFTRDQVFELITQKATEGLGVSRSSIWFYNADKTGIVCKDLYVSSAGTHAQGTELFCTDFPKYFDALKAGITIAADNAHTHPATAEFSKPYLTPLNIQSMLDVPVRIKGEMIGVICNEVVGRSWIWTMEDETFAKTLSSILSAGLEAVEEKRKNNEMREAQNALSNANVTMAALLEEIEESKKELEEKNIVLAEYNQEMMTTEEELRQNLEELEIIQESLKKQQLEIEENNKRLNRQNAVVNKLFNLNLSEMPANEAFKKITEACAEGLQTERSSIWLYDSSFSGIKCEDLFIKSQGHSSGTELFARDFPKYFQALKTEETLAAHNAHTHEATFEFSEVYLKPLNIQSMLDIPIRIKGRMVGVLCNEHTVDFRTWQVDEENFGKTLSAMISMVMESEERRNSQMQLMEANRELSTQEEELRQNMEELEAIQEQLKKQNAEIEKQAQISKRQNKILSEMAGKSYGKNLTTEQIYQDITQKLTEGLGIDRSSIWIYNENKTAIISANLYEVNGKKHSSGVSLFKTDFPKYFEALIREESLIASNAHIHPDTSEFSEVYLKPLGIFSMLDIPIRVNGEMIGVICNESLQPKLWNLEDESFARSVSSVISLVLENEEKQKMELALQESRERFELAIQGSKDGLWDWNIATGALYFSPRWKEILGYQDEEFENNMDKFWAAIHPEDLNKVRDHLQNYLIKANDKYEIEFRMYHKDGLERWILGRGTALFDENEQPTRMVGFHSDITKRKESEQKEMLNEKMATLGTLMAGVAHEINTPLGAIRASGDNMSNQISALIHDMPGVVNNFDLNTSIAFTEMVDQAMAPKNQLTTREERQLKKQVTEALDSMNVPDSKNLADNLVKVGIYEPNLYPNVFHHIEHKEIIKVITNIGKIYSSIDNVHLAVNKCQKMIMALKNYSNTRDFDKPVITDVSKSMETVLMLYHNAMKHGIDLVKNYDIMPSMYCFEDELNQVWTNLIWNAIQAMKGNGKLTISTLNKENGIEVLIEDNGPGIPKEIQQKIFEPFFTTKPKGEGTGLGLDICRKIVAKHYGELTVESEPGCTVFKVTIPFNSPLQQQKEIQAEVVA